MGPSVKFVLTIIDLFLLPKGQTGGAGPRGVCPLDTLFPVSVFLKDSLTVPMQGAAIA